MSKKRSSSAPMTSVAARKVDDVEKTTVSEQPIPETVGIDIIATSSTSELSDELTSESSSVNEEVNDAVTDTIKIEEKIEKFDDKRIESNANVLEEKTSISTNIVEETPIDIVKNNVSVSTDIVEETTPTVSVEYNVGLSVDDHINATVRNVPGKSGRGEYLVKDLLKYQFIIPDAEIIVTDTLKRPLLKLLKTVKSLDKVPVIYDGVRANAVRKFCLVNRISVINA